MKHITTFGLGALGTILLAKLHIVGLFAFLQGTAGLWYPIAIGISSLGFRTNLIPKALAMTLFVGGTAMYIVVKSESFADRLARRFP